jgi:uncharacterized protein YndB with AHSA1/START domain
VLTVSRTRSVAAPREELWDVIRDPHHLPRWWPRVSRMEAVEDDAFTEVLMGPSGKIVRADFKLLDATPRQRIVWSQLVDDTPFARVLQSAETEILLADADDVTTAPTAATAVTIELRQQLHGFRGGGLLSLRIAGIARFGSPLVRRAALSTIDEALEGLQRIVGSHP